MAHDEHVLAQERELDKLMKRCTAARTMLKKNQAQKMFMLEQALKGWFNPKKVMDQAAIQILGSVCEQN